MNGKVVRAMIPCARHLGAGLHPAGQVQKDSVQPVYSCPRRTQAAEMGGSGRALSCPLERDRSPDPCMDLWLGWPQGWEEMGRRGE
jgi:hypothetical protein